VPTDGQPYEVQVTLRGTLIENAGQWSLGGGYTARRADGQPLYDDVRTVEGVLAGKAEPVQAGLGDGAWRVAMPQVRAPGGMDLDALDVTLGVAGGKVCWGLIGQTAEPNWPATKRYPIDVSGFGPVTDTSIVQGSIVLTERHLHPGGDPARHVRMDLTVRRVQGFVGGEAALTRLTDGKPVGDTTHAYGRGSLSAGGGTQAPRGLWIHDLDTRPWWQPVEGFTPVAPGEHPRLLFRKADVPALRARAETPDGKAIIARLRKLLGKDGEAIPDRFSPTPPDNHRKAPALPMGAFTSWHGMGYGFLYQLTGEAKYADLARQSIELMFAGKYDIDNRYSWVKPGTDLRCGTVMSAVAYAYDFCYDAWPDNFRRKVALELQNYNQEVATGGRIGLAHLVGRSNYPPGSNHYGSLIGDTGVALLGILGDPGVDSALVEQRLSEAESNVPRMLELGFGDAGWFAEGFGSSSGLSRVPMHRLIMAERAARGRDYLRPRPNAQWMSLFWAMHLGGSGYAAIPNRGVYEGDNDPARDGEFALLFGAIEEKYKPAMLWSYQTFVGSREPKAQLGCAPGEQSWDAELYPRSAVFAFVNWPIGVEPANPATVLPLTAVDHVHGYFVARNRWQDSDDIIVTHALEYGPQGYYGSVDMKGEQKAGFVRIWGYGLRTSIGTGITGGPVTHYAQAADGSFTFTRGASALAVDYSKASGAEAVVLAVGPAALRGAASAPAKNAKASTRTMDLTLNGTPVRVFTLQTGEPPAISVEGNAVVVGGQRYVWDGQRLAPLVFLP
jgi:hypothetical protein